MNLTRVQIKSLSEGDIEVIELQEREREKNKSEKKSSQDGIKNSVKKKDEKSNNSFHSLLGIPGIKMTDKAREKYLDNKRKEIKNA